MEMSLVHPLRAFPPKTHADSHEYGGTDLVTDLDRLLIRGTEVIDTSRNLKNIVSGNIAGDLTVGGTVKPASLTLGSYVLDTLVANNKVPDSDKLDGLHASGFTLDKVLSYGRSSTRGIQTFVDFSSPNRTAHVEADGALYRYDGQCYLTFDDWLYFRSKSGWHNHVEAYIKYTEGLWVRHGIKTDGNIIAGGDLQVKGNDIKDSGGTVRITLGSTNTISGNLKVTGTFLAVKYAEKRAVKISTTSTTVVNMDVSVSITIKSGKIFAVAHIGHSNASGGKAEYLFINIAGSRSPVARDESTFAGTGGYKYTAPVVYFRSGLGAGTFTVKLQWRVNGGVGYSYYRCLYVMEVS